MTLVRLDSTARVVSSISLSNAHASAITAVKILRSQSSKGSTTLSVASSGNDQRVKLWCVAIDLAGETASISLQLDRYCPVADIAAMDTLDTLDTLEVLVLGGVGMEMINLRPPCV